LSKNSNTMSRWKAITESPSKMGAIVVGSGVFITFSIAGALNYRHIKEKRRIRRLEWHKKASKMLSDYKYTDDFIGRPLKVAPFDTMLTEYKVYHYEAETEAQAYIPVKGSKGEGTLHVVASREGENHSWIIEKLDLELTKQQHRWTFYDRQRCLNPAGAPTHSPPDSSSDSPTETSTYTPSENSSNATNNMSSNKPSQSSINSSTDMVSMSSNTQGASTKTFNDSPSADKS